MAAALTYEWRRVTSLRSTWWMSAFFVLTSAGMAALTVLVTQPTDGAGPSPLELSGLLLSPTNLIPAVFLAVVAASAFGHEYRYGLIRLTLTAFPRRPVVLAAKTLVVLLWTVLLYAVAAAASVVVAAGVWSRVVVDPAWGAAAAALRGVVFTMGWALLVLAFSLLTRTLAVAVVIPLVWGAIAEPLVIATLGTRLPWLADAVPVNAGFAFAAGTDGSTWRDGLVFAAWLVALMGSAAWLLVRRDA